MEEAVWIVFGVIAVIIGLVIVANIIVTNKDEIKLQDVTESFEKIKQKCDFVCNSPLETYLSVEVELPSGLLIYASGQRICGNVNISAEHSNDTICVLCMCPVVMRTPLNLQTELARKSFSVHKYYCYFERMDNEVAMECKG
ncbi:MAG: hypothetical protein QXK37_06345 [Candidatus Woesearchaeota archaeon]